MRSLPGIFKEHPDALVIIVGGESVSYGKNQKRVRHGGKNFSMR